MKQKKCAVKKNTKEPFDAIHCNTQLHTAAHAVSTNSCSRVSVRRKLINMKYIILKYTFIFRGNVV